MGDKYGMHRPQDEATIAEAKKIEESQVTNVTPLDRIL